MGPVHLVAGEFEGGGGGGEGGVVAGFAGFGQGQQGGERAGVVQQGFTHAGGQGDGCECLVAWHAQHGVQQRKHAGDKCVVGGFGHFEVGGEQLHKPAAHRCGVAHHGRDSTGVGGGHQQRGPAEQFVHAQRGDRVAERGDLIFRAGAGGVDETQQVQGQAGVLLQQLFDLGHGGLFVHQGDQLQCGCLGRLQGGGFHQGRALQPEALEQRDTQRRHTLVLRFGFDLLRNDLRLGVAAYGAHQLFGHVRAEGRHVQLDERCQRQPCRVDLAQHRLVECQPKPARAQLAQTLGLGLDLLWCAVHQGGHFQHHQVGVNQLQVAAGQALVGAVDEQGFGADHCFAARMGQGVKQEGRVTGCGMGIACNGAVEQLVAKNGA